MNAPPVHPPAAFDPGRRRPRILLLAGTGQVGRREPRRALAPLGEVAAPGRDRADLLLPDSLRVAMRDVAPALARVHSCRTPNYTCYGTCGCSEGCSQNCETQAPYC